MIDSSDFEETKLSEISVVLRKLGVYRTHKGYNRLAYAVYLVSENGSRLEAVVKEVYMPVAEKYRCTWSADRKSTRLNSSHA